jgi:transcriptional regulator with XRE-family HTH domain
VSTFNYALLRRWRLEAGLKPEQACARADISYSYLASLERGTGSNPSAAILIRLASFYGRDNIRELFDPDLADAR